MQQPLLHLARPARRVLGLDGQLDRAARRRDQFEQPLQGEYGGAAGRPVRALRSGGLLAVLPGAEVECGEIGEFQGGDGAAAVGRTVHPAVVHADQMAVGGQPYIALQGVGAVLDGLPVGGEGVFRGVLGGSPVGDDLDAGAAACVRSPRHGVTARTRLRAGGHTADAPFAR